MSTHSGGNPRFRGPGSLWKSSWKGRKKLPPDRFDMPFFLRFVDQVGDAGQYYSGTGLFGPPFQGGPGTWLGAAIQIAVGSPAEARSLMGVFGVSGGGPAGWRLDIDITNHVIFTVGLGQNGGALSVTGPAVIPGTTYVFICDVQQPAPGTTQIDFYVPGPTGIAQLFATNSAGFSFNSTFGVPFNFGVVDPAVDVGAHGLHLAGLSMGLLKNIVVPTAYTQFFLSVRDLLSIPAIAGNDRIAAAAVYPNVPNPYVTDAGNNLTIQGGSTPILNVKFFPNFPY